MRRVHRGRHVGEIDGDFVVFLIGARPDLRHPLRSLTDLGGRAGMPRMLAYLLAHPDKGLLGYTAGFPISVQYWRSFAHLEAFARDRDDPHLAAWRRYLSRARRHEAAGVWHETYLVRAGEYEAIYNNMPTVGLAAAGRLVAAPHPNSARARLQRAASTA